MKHILCLSLLVAAIVGSASGANARSISFETTAPAWTGPAFIDSTEILYLESYPVQVHLLVRGHLPTPCHAAAWAIEDAGGRVDVRLWSEADPEVACVQVLEPFEVSIPLGSYESADVAVSLNGDPAGHITIGTADPAVLTDPPALIGSGWSFGMCGGYCVADLEVDGMALRLTGRGHIVEDPLYVNAGSLTPKGRQELDAVLAALAGVRLEPIYGCPDCADGGASYITLERAGKASRHLMDFGAPPQELAEVQALSMAIISRLESCTPSDLVAVDEECRPYNAR